MSWLKQFEKTNRHQVRLVESGPRAVESLQAEDRPLVDEKVESEKQQVKPGSLEG